MPRVSQRYRDARRRQITDAARRCFARTGFHATPMADVFAESGLSAGAVYGHFSGKDDLVEAIINEVLSEITAALDTVTETEPPPPLSEVLGRVVQVLDTGSDGTRDGDHGDLARLAVQVWAEASRRPELRGRMASSYRQVRERFSALVRRYQREKILDPTIEPAHVAQVLTALGPAFLAQQALLDDITAETFTRGLEGLLGPARPRDDAKARTSASTSSHHLKKSPSGENLGYGDRHG